MKKDILTNQRIDDLVSRLQKLDPFTEPLWGKLNMNGMLHHCNLVTTLIISSKKTRKPKLKERLMKPVFYVMQKLPKNFQSGSQYLAEKPDLLEFEKDRKAFMQTLMSLKNYKETLMGVHPVFGPLNTNEWRKFILLHTDHHLRQFKS